MWENLINCQACCMGGTVEDSTDKRGVMILISF